jgi:hypothetical protein
VESAADDGGGVVGAAAAEGGGDAVAGADEAAHDGDAREVDEGKDLGGEGGFDGGLVGGGLAVVVVGEDDGAGVDVGGGDGLLREGGGAENGGEAFAEADYVVGGARGELAYGGDAARRSSRVSKS